jgi:hypothetical protein
MKPARLQLDFAPHARRGSEAGRWLLAIGVLAFGVAAVPFCSALLLHARHSRALAVAAEGPAAATPAAARAARPDAAERARVQWLRQTTSRLLTPWADLLAAVEEAPAKVALLSLEPAAAQRSASLTAEAANAQDMLGYVRALQDDGRLSGVVLVSHQVQTQAAGAPWRFQVQARWGGAVGPAAAPPPATPVAMGPAGDGAGP